MARHYTAYQYERAYVAKSLRNWEVPKFYCDKPTQRSGRTKIIANSRGHLLPGVKKGASSPWGNFVGTWDYPKRIDRQTANIFNGLGTRKEDIARCEALYRAARERLPKYIEEREKAEEEKLLEELEKEKEVKAAKEVKEVSGEMVEGEQPVQEQPVQEEVKVPCPIHDLIY